MNKITRRTSLRTVLIGAAASMAAPGIARAAEKVSVRLKWLPQGQFAGYYVAKAKGYYEAAGLDVTINPGGPNLNSEALVAAGSDTFGVGGGSDSILFARAKNLPLVSLAMMFQGSATVFVSRKSSGIVEPKDFKGKKVGTWFTGAQYLTFAMMAKAGLSPSDATIVPQPATNTPFINGELDVLTTVNYNTLIALERTIPAAELNHIYPEKYGLSTFKDPLITSEKVIAEKPEMVQKVMNASMKGWRYAVMNKAETVDILLKAGGPALERKHQEAMMDVIASLVLAGAGKTKGVGYTDKVAIVKEQEALLDLKALTEKVDIDKAFNTSFWDAVPKADKEVA